MKRRMNEGLDTKSNQRLDTHLHLVVDLKGSLVKISESKSSDKWVMLLLSEFFFTDVISDMLYIDIRGAYSWFKCGSTKNAEPGGGGTQNKKERPIGIRLFSLVCSLSILKLAPINMVQFFVSYSLDI